VSATPNLDKAQLDRVLLVQHDARHARDRVAAQCRELINDIAGTLDSSHLSADPGLTFG
jgi:hypothetical protein